MVSGDKSARTSLLIGLICFLVYNANVRSISPGDAYPARYQPFGLLRYGTLSLEPIEDLVRQGRGAGAYWVQSGAGGRAISLYPVVLPVLISPLYVPAASYLQSRGWPARSLERAARIMEKLTASLLASIAAALLYRLLRRRASPRHALLLTLVFAFGTTTWMISSQALWQHTLAEPLIIGALLLVTGPVTPARIIAAGFVLGLIAGNRPPDALLAAAIGIHGLWWAGRRAPLLVSAAAVPAGLVLAYNLVVAGHWAGGYGIAGRAEFLEGKALLGLAGLLFSPTHGLFVFSPFLLIVPWAIRRSWNDAGNRRLTLALCVAMALQLLLYAKADWTGGASWGPRWLTDVLPILFWMLPLVTATLRGASRVALVAACGVAIAIEAIGAFWYINASDAAIATAPNPSWASWDLRNAPFVVELRHPRAVADLWGRSYDCTAKGAEGNLDRLLVDQREVPVVAPDVEFRAEGWTLIGGRTPWEVAAVMDGQSIASTSRFLVRQDVVVARGSASPAGWSIPIRASRLTPGEHVLGVVARSCESGEAQAVVERRIVVADLAASARRAAAAIKEHQQAAGYWLTSYTSKREFERPHEEMNTFLTATLVDMLDPIASAAGLDESLVRARRHLAAQIEDDGLVRYHGLPDAPTIGQLGCAISPDADDTSLVWRIAPGDRPERLRRALATLAQYRTDEGLYRTWLAPRERYQCLDPGHDPNPTDVAIQMHVLMLLARADPPAARSLCSALTRVANEDRLWVYYGLTPIVPILRQIDLAAAGCPLELPATRLHPSVEPQRIWVQASKQLWRLGGGPAPEPAPEPEERLAALLTLSANDFAALRHDPPLLYHNDLSGTVSRFYWSEDFGYALWLRLYFEHTHRSPAPAGAGV
jgi:hypothetical protein